MPNYCITLKTCLLLLSEELLSEQILQDIDDTYIFKTKLTKASTGRYLINNLTLHFKDLEKQWTKPKDSRSKEIMMIRVEVIEMETKVTNEKIYETMSWAFEKIKIRPTFS